MPKGETGLHIKFLTMLEQGGAHIQGELQINRELKLDVINYKSSFSKRGRVLT